MSKTETIKKRAIYVYLPSEESIKKWKLLAKEAKTSISKFVIEHVENSINQDTLLTQKSKNAFNEEIHALKKELDEKEKQIQRKDRLIETYEEDLRRYRASVFIDDSPPGAKQYNKKLVEIIQEPGSHQDEEIVRRMNVNPRETKVMKSITMQLDLLQEYGLIKSTSKGWVWVK
jgi:hypothetical protein